MMISASVALNYCAAASGNLIFPIDDAGSGAQFTMLNGFHNSPANESENVDEIEDLVDGAVNDGIGDDWGDLMSHRNGSVFECSVSSLTSSSSSNADDLFFWGGFRDFKDTGSHVQHWYYYDCGRSECYDLPWC